MDKQGHDNRANQCNPNHGKTGEGRDAGYKGTGDRKDLDNHGNQLNPNHQEFRGEQQKSAGQQK